MRFWPLKRVLTGIFSLFDSGTAFCQEKIFKKNLGCELPLGKWRFYMGPPLLWNFFWKYFFFLNFFWKLFLRKLPYQGQIGLKYRFKHVLEVKIAFKKIFRASLKNFFFSAKTHVSIPWRFSKIRFGHFYLRAHEYPIPAVRWWERLKFLLNVDFRKF